MGFTGIIIFEGVFDEVSVEAAATRYVGGSGPGNWTKIQDAIDNASAGDTIRVYDGTYFENVDVNKSVTLIGNGTGVTTINGSGWRDCVYIDTDWVNLTGFTITNSGSFLDNAGIKLENVQNCSIFGNELIKNSEGIMIIASSNNNITDNTCSFNDYTGIQVENTIISCVNNLIFNNTCSNNGKGISLIASLVGLINNNKIINNTCKSNSLDGISSHYSNRNLFMGNNCSNNNVGIYINTYSFGNTVKNNFCSSNTWQGITMFGGPNLVIANNSCSYNGGDGLWLVGTTQGHIINNTCTNNLDDGILVWDECTGNTLKNNNCSDNEKRGISVYTSFKNRFENNSMYSNKKFGIQLYDSHNNSFANNTCSENDNGIDVFYQSSDNKFMNNIVTNNDNIGIFFNYTSKNNIISNCTITYNSQGIVFVNSSSATANNNSIMNNAIYGINNTDPSIVIDATYNWWGYRSGPYDPSDDRATGGWFNPLGLGDNVTDYVKYTPWILQNFQPKIQTNDKLNASEDSLYFVKYIATDANIDDIIYWKCSTNASWLNWNNSNTTLFGIPDNSQIGNYWICINVTDGNGGLDEHNFTLTVINRAPRIINDDLELAIEDHTYYCDYDSDDDGQGIITWELNSNATWLGMDANSGNLSGMPANEDIGTYWVNVIVFDGNGGENFTNFTLTVLNTNDAPFIETTDVTSVNQDQYYEVAYTALDPDPGDILTWTCESNATWLNWGSANNTLFGMPGNDDVGIYWVLINISDGNFGFDEHYFNLAVINVNDEPIIDTNDVLLTNEDEHYSVVYSGHDIDLGDTITWTYESNASWLNWGSINNTLYGTPRNENVGIYWVRINISDDKNGYDEHYFILTVENVNDAPTISGAPNKLKINASEDYLLDLSPYINDVDNDLSKLILYTSSDHATINGFTIIFNYPSSVTLDEITITAFDGLESSTPHNIMITVTSKSIDYPLIENNTPNGNNVPISTKITVTFDRPMSKSTVQDAFSITPTINGDFEWTGNKLIFIPGSYLVHNTTYMVTISGTAKDLANNNLEADHIWSFTTEKKMDGEEPSITDKDDQETNLLLPILILVTIIIIIIVLVYLFLIRKKKPQEKIPQGEETPTSQPGLVEEQQDERIITKPVQVAQPGFEPIAQSETVIPVTEPLGVPTTIIEQIPVGEKIQPVMETKTQMHQPTQDSVSPSQTIAPEPQTTTTIQEQTTSQAPPILDDQPHLQPQETTTLATTDEQTQVASETQQTPQKSIQQPEAQTQIQAQTIPCPICQKVVQLYTNPCPNCGGELEWR